MLNHPSEAMRKLFRLKYVEDIFAESLDVKRETLAFLGGLLDKFQKANIKVIKPFRLTCLSRMSHYKFTMKRGTSEGVSERCGQF